MKPHCVYTLFRNLTFALFPALLTLFSGGNGVFFAAAFLAFVAAVVLAFVFPVRQDEPLENAAKAFFGFFGGMGLLVMAGFMLVIGIICIDAVTSGRVEAEYATYSELSGQRIARALHMDAMIPPEASKIRFTGFGGGLLMGWGRHAEFSCTAAEALGWCSTLTRVFCVDAIQATDGCSRLSRVDAGGVRPSWSSGRWRIVRICTSSGRTPTCANCGGLMFVSPGWIDTTGTVYSGADAERHPAGRIGNPLDIANVVLSLASDKAGFITGESVCVDVGTTRQMIYHNDFCWMLHRA